MAAHPVRKPADGESRLMPQGRPGCSRVRPLLPRSVHDVHDCAGGGADRGALRRVRGSDRKSWPWKYPPFGFVRFHGRRSKGPRCLRQRLHSVAHNGKFFQELPRGLGACRGELWSSPGFGTPFKAEADVEPLGLWCRALSGLCRMRCSRRVVTLTRTHTHGATASARGICGASSGSPKAMIRISGPPRHSAWHC